MTSPRLASLLLAVALGCSSASEPAADLPALGTYTYSADVRHLGAATSTHHTGTLKLTFVSEDSIAGVWSVPDYETRATLGFFNASAYVLDAHPSPGDGGVVAHRIGRSASPSCEVRYLWQDDTGLHTNVGTCTLAKQ